MTAYESARYVFRRPAPSSALPRPPAVRGGRSNPIDDAGAWSGRPEEPSWGLTRGALSEPIVTAMGCVGEMNLAWNSSPARLAGRATSGEGYPLTMITRNGGRPRPACWTTTCP